MAARAKALGDTGESSPEHWEKPLGIARRPRRHDGVAPDERAPRGGARARARGLRAPAGRRPRSGGRTATRSPTEREPFGFRDGISHPAIEGSGIPGPTRARRRSRPANSCSATATRRAAFRRCRSPTCWGATAPTSPSASCTSASPAFRRYLRDNARDRDDEELLAAKMMGRWRSGAPLARCPLHDDPELGADPRRNNDFVYGDDAIGYKTPPGSHIRRANPRDADVAGVVRLHRMIRRGTAYGPAAARGRARGRRRRPRPDVRVRRRAPRSGSSSSCSRSGSTAATSSGSATSRIPSPARTTATASFSIPRRPMPRRLHGLSRFVVTRGGEYGFMPGLRALRWLAELRT